jgi:predicted porin
VIFSRPYQVGEFVDLVHFLNLGVFMKKSLVALAVLAASGASFAQSSVTLYGLLDIWGGTLKTTDGVTGASLTNTVLESGGVNGSRWGVKGSEDLGGGLKAIFNLEQGLKLDTGAATAGQAFSRQAYVGFAGGFGEVKIGKPWTAYDDVSGASNAVFDSALAPMNNVFASTGYKANPGNTVYYATPSMGGFAGAFSYSLGEDKASAATAPTLTVNGRTADVTSVTSMNVTYGAGPFAAQFGYQVEGTNVIFVGGAEGADAKFTRLGASYDLGVAAVKASYGKVTNVGNVSGADTTEYQIGADFPVSSALTLSASYAKSDDNSTAGDQSRKGYGIAAAYTLSKRTFLYGGYNANTFTNAGAGDDKLDILAVGVQHKF